MFKDKCLNYADNLDMSDQNINAVKILHLILDKYCVFMNIPMIAFG